MLTLPDLDFRFFVSLSLKLDAGVDGCDLDEVSEGASNRERVGVDGRGGDGDDERWNVGVGGTNASCGVDLAALDAVAPLSV